MYFSSTTLLSLTLLATTALANPSFPLRRHASSCDPVIDPNVCQFLPGIGEVDPNNKNNCLFGAGPGCDCQGLDSPSGTCAVAVCSGTNSYVSLTFSFFIWACCVVLNGGKTGLM